MSTIRHPARVCYHAGPLCVVLLMLIPVVLAGGAGTRLWPLSRSALPKQFAAFPGRENTLFQESLLRLGDRAAAPLVVCNEEHRFLAAEQLRQAGITDARILLEPAPRNTAPAAALAAMAAMESDPDALLLVLPSDHLIEQAQALLAAVDEAEDIAGEGGLVTFGVAPDAPATGYGYLAAGEPIAGTAAARKLEHFVEKPDSATARRYFDSGGYLWNSGMFLFRAAAYLAELENFAPDIHASCRHAHSKVARSGDFHRYDAAIFADCPGKSIDHAVMEHTRRGAVVPLAAGWSDLGAWDAVLRQSPRDAGGNAVSGDVLIHDTRDSLVRAGSRLVATLGLRDTLIIDTADALLVADRASAQDVGEIAAALRRAGRAEAQHHRLVKRPWGSYESLATGPGFQVKHLVIHPGAAISLQKHQRRAEHWTVVRGRGIVTCGEREFALGVNESTFIPLGSKHRLRNDGAEPVEIIEVQIGDYLGEDDIIRFDDRYGRAGDG